MNNENQITFKIHPKLKRALQSLAKQEGLSVSDIVRMSVIEKIKGQPSFFCIKRVAINNKNSKESK